MSDIFGLGLSHQTPKPSIFRRLLQIPAVGLSLVLIVAVVAVGVVGVGKVFKPKPADDYVGGGTDAIVQVDVQPGDSATDIGRALVAAGVVKSVTAFVDASNADTRAADIQPGTYALHPQMSAASAISLLVLPSSLVGAKVTVPEGTRLTKTEQIIAANSQITGAALGSAVARSGDLGLPVYAQGKPEGFLYPATYTVETSTTATAMLAQMVARFKQVALAIGLEPGAAQLKLTPYQVVTIASLIEAEVKRPQDYALVAEVIVNRLHKGLPLQLDSTVNYALGTSHPFLSAADLKTASPYNTYLHAGLPPTPINSPGQAALFAALHPAVGDFIYFVTTDPTTGDTTFTASASEANKLRIVAQKNAAAEASAAAASAAASAAAATATATASAKP
jgi:UPF0755 protein